ncbi:hypothetical protein IJG72_03320 [bacterium]|nr:hypothetical protein [bacterium]
MAIYNTADSISKTSNILGLVAKRQKLLTENIANVDTPNYVRKDIDFKSVLSNMNGPMETTLSKQMGSTSLVNEQTDEIGVNITDELINMQENSLIYTMAIRRMSNVINIMKTVVNVGK